MKVWLVGRDLPMIEQLITHYGMSLSENNPEVVISHGGDGSLLEAERLYPGIPKLPIRRRSICKNCVDHDTGHLIKYLAQGKLEAKTIDKLEATSGSLKKYALNEFSFYHQRPNQAIRFSVRINDELHIEQAIGDGLIVASPFGSHAYYRSITKSTFRVGLGLAFNNTTEPIDHLVIKPTDSISFILNRGPAHWLTDNDPEFLDLAEDQIVTIKTAKEQTTILGLDEATCPDCDQPLIAFADETKTRTKRETSIKQ